MPVPAVLTSDNYSAGQNLFVMQKILPVKMIVFCFVLLTARGFAQNDKKAILGLQFGAGAFSFNANQYNAVASYSDAHVKSGNAYPQFVLALSAFPVTSKYNIDIGGGGWETSNKIHGNLFPRIYSTNGFRIKQSFAFGEINFNYGILGTARTLVIPAIGIGFMNNNLHYQYKSPANAEQDKEDQDDDDGSGDNNTNIKIARNNVYYLNFRLNYLIHADKRLWYGLQIGYKYGFHEHHTLYNPEFPVTASHLLNGFYASLIIAL